MNTLSAKELKKALDNGEILALLDVRSAAEYQEKHIPGALNSPADADMVTGLPNQNEKIVVYALNSEGEAQSIVQKLIDAGYTDVTELEGGLMAWMEAGGMVDSGSES